MVIKGWKCYATFAAKNELVILLSDKPGGIDNIKTPVIITE